MSLVLNGTSGVTTNSGTLISASTIGVGGTSPAASGAGISFPATQSASTDANTLDDYEEGTWTPRLYKNSVEITSLVYASGNYVKIGKALWLSIYIYKASGTSASGGVWQIGNLPYAIEQSTYGTLYSSVLAGYSTINSTQVSGVPRWQASGSTTVNLLNGTGSVSTDWTTGIIEFAFTGTLQATA